MARDVFKPFLLLIHYWFPVGLGWSVVLVIHQATGLPILSSGFHLYLLGIFAAYSFDRIVDSADSAEPLWVKTALVHGFLFSTVIGFFLAVQLPIQTFVALLLFSMITLLYFWAKRLPFVKGFLVAIVWGWAGIALPFANTHWFAWQFWTMRISLPVVLLIACNVILCDFKDIGSDHRHGVKSLPAVLGSRRAIWVISILLTVAAFISYEENLMVLVIGSALMLAVTQFPRLLAVKALGPLIVDASLTVPGLLIVLHLVS